jgi:hypothetical protein
MIAMNIVRFRVKPGLEEAFVEAHRKAMQPFEGFLGGNLVKTGERTYCFVGQWRSFDYLAGARPQMVGLLDSFRHMLEDLGADLGVTDPVSGMSVVSLPGSRPAKKPAARKASAKKRPAKKPKARAKPKAKARAKKQA